jgi:hypothetical protein
MVKNVISGQKNMLYFLSTKKEIYELWNQVFCWISLSFFLKVRCIQNKSPKICMPHEM